MLTPLELFSKLQFSNRITSTLNFNRIYSEYLHIIGCEFT